MPIQLHDTHNVSQSVLRDAISHAFGADAARFVRAIAEKDDFADFAEMMGLLGFATLSSDISCKPYDDGMITLSSFSTSSLMPPIVNAAICMRYPFVLEYTVGLNAKDDPSVMDAKALSTKLSGNMLCSLESGWLRRFGLELCEDTRIVLESSADPDKAFMEYEISQMKSMYARFRWYARGIPMDVAPQLEDLRVLYEALSIGVCKSCGSMSEVRVDKDGSLSAMCIECRMKTFDMMDNSFGNEKERKTLIHYHAHRHGYNVGGAALYVPQDIMDKVKRYLLASLSKPDETVADNVLMTSNTNEYDPYERLRLLHPDLRIFNLIMEHDMQVLSEMAGCGIDERDYDKAIGKAVAEENEKQEQYQLVSRERAVQILS